MSEKKPQMIRIRSLKKKRRKEVKEDINLVALERFHCLVALERFQCLIANGRFQCLVALGRRRRSIFSPLPTSPPTNFTKY